MPCISQFYGISIYIYHVDHAPPYVHAIQGEHNASYSILDGTRLNGEFPPRADRLVREWLQLRRADVLASWEHSRRGDAPLRVAPLD